MFEVPLAANTNNKLCLISFCIYRLIKDLDICNSLVGIVTDEACPIYKWLETSVLTVKKDIQDVMST